MARIFEKLSSGINEVGTWMFFLMMLVIAATVVARYFFGTAIPGSIEIVQMMQVIGVGLCAAYAQRQGANVNVDLFVNMAPTRTRNVLHVITTLLSLGTVALLTYGVFKISSTTGAMRETTDTLRLPLYPVKWLLGAGFAFVTAQLVAELFQSITILRRGGNATAEDHSQGQAADAGSLHGGQRQ